MPFPHHQVDLGPQAVISARRCANPHPRVVARLSPRLHQGHPLLLPPHLNQDLPLLLASVDMNIPQSVQVSAQPTVTYLLYGGQGHRLRAQNRVRMKLRSR